MAWLYVPESEDSNSDCASSGRNSGLSAGSSTTPMLPRAWWLGCKRARWGLHLCGMTSRHSTDENGVELWISSRLASRASRGVVPDSGEESRTSDGSGQTLRGSFARWDLSSSSWRTRQGSLLTGESDTFSGAWPKWGSLRNGAVGQHRLLGHRRAGTGCSSWPTPMARAAPGSPSEAKRRSPCLEKQAQTCMGLWATPTAGNEWDRATKYAQGGSPLTLQAQQWATPRAIYGEHPGMKSHDHTTGQAIGLLESTTSGAGQPSSQSDPTSRRPLRLNPKFVEWLNGLPDNWTHLYVVSDYAAWATRWCRSRQPTQ